MGVDVTKATVPAGAAAAKIHAAAMVAVAADAVVDIDLYCGDRIT